MYPKISPVRALVLGAIVATFPLPGRAVPTYTLTVSAGTAAAHVQPNMFGTNVVYDALDVAQWPTFISTFNALGMKSLRYPGGVVTEAGFDFKDSNGPANDCITLSHFLQAVAANGMTPILVVPTKKFETNYTTTGAQYAKDFVKAVNIDHGVAGGEQFGTAQTVQFWEMGNEYYTNNSGGPPLSPSTYGKIANKFGSAMKTIDGSINPVVQFQRSTPNDTQTIADQLTPGVMGRCVTHLYPGGSETFSSVQSQVEGGATTFGLTPMITEWNMANGLTTGLTLGNYVPKLFQAQVDAGVKISTHWPLMWWNNSVDTALATNSGQLRPQGQVYQWLNQCANNRDSVPTSSSSSAISCLAWKDTSGHLSVLVLCGASQTNATVAITINGYNGSNFVVTSDQRLYAAGGPGTETANTPALVTNVSEAKSGNVLTITTNKNTQQEVIRIDITRL
jgi:hypothetical protein